MFCTNCGSKIKDGASFCGKCGTPVKKRPQPQNEPFENTNVEAPEEIVEVPEDIEISGPETENIPDTEISSADTWPQEIPDTEITPAESEKSAERLSQAPVETERPAEYIKPEPVMPPVDFEPRWEQPERKRKSPALKIGIIVLVVLLLAFAVTCALVYLDVLDIPVLERMLGVDTPSYVDRDDDDDDDRDDEGEDAKISDQGLNSFVMDISDVTWYIECEYGKDAVEDCRYYEFYIDNLYFILAQYPKNEDEFDYCLFGYSYNDLEDMYYSRSEYSGSVLIARGLTNGGSLTTTDESKLEEIEFNLSGDAKSIYVAKDKKSEISKIAVSYGYASSGGDSGSGVTIFEYGYKDGRISRIDIYDDNLPGLAEAGYRVRYSYGEDGSLSAVRNETYALDEENSGVSNSGWNFSYNFSYDSDGNRTGISERQGDASLRFTRNPDGRVDTVTYNEGSEELQTYKLEYLPDGTVKYSLLNGPAEDDGKLVVAVCANNEPYEYIEGGRIIGFDIDLISTIAIDLGLDCEIVELSYGDLPASLAEGTADVVMTATQVSGAFRNSCDASLPYHEDGYSVYLQKGSELVSEINRLLADYERSGYIETLLRRWGLYEEPVTDYYILPNSNSAYLSESDLRGLSWEECCLARNEIFARHHRIFSTPEIAAYFESQSWYSGTVSPSRFSESVFNQYESSNLKLIQSYEDRVWGGSYY